MQQEVVNDFMGNISGLLVGVVVLVLGVYLMRQKRGRNAHHTVPHL